MKQIRNVIGVPAVTEEVTKFFSLSAGASKMQAGDGTMTGFLSRKSDVQHLQGSQQVVDAVRTDFPNGMQAGAPYGVLRTRLSQQMVDNIGVPRVGMAYDPLDSRDVLPPSSSQGFPTTGHGFSASRDGRLYPECHMKQPTNMPTENDETVFEFRRGDGTLMPVDDEEMPIINGQSSSIWTVIVHPKDSTRRLWIPRQ